MPLSPAIRQVQRLFAAGASLSAAVRESLPPRDSLVRLASRRQLPRTSFVSALTGRQAETRAMRVALAAELGGQVDEWAALFAAQRRTAAAARLAAPPAQPETRAA